METDSKGIENEGPSKIETDDVHKDTFEVNSRPICMIVLGMAGR